MLENVFRPKLFNSWVISGKTFWRILALPLSSEAASLYSTLQSSICCPKILAVSFAYFSNKGSKIYTQLMWASQSQNQSPGSVVWVETMEYRLVMAKRKKKIRWKDLESLGPLHISWVTKEAASIKNSHSSVTQEINQVLNWTTLPGRPPHQASGSWHCGHQYL